DHTREILTNYTEAIDTLLEADIPLVGFVKNIASRRVVQRLRDEALCPWSTDSAFFKRVLGREREENDAAAAPTQTETSDGSLRFTNWFVSEFYVERTVYSDDAPWAPDLSHPTESYLPTEMYIYDPRRDLLYKAESP
ncbi:MAG: DNA double-strand break repair nuclease NurA, partial [Halobacteria archaeon]|nr:DNA double-strand break repair nuclease NurA [Halobacteria archaeon]